jgi:hypothetical protein
MGFNKETARKHKRAIIARIKELQKDEELRLKTWLELEKYSKEDLKNYPAEALRISIEENEQLRKGSKQGKKDSK